MSQNPSSADAPLLQIRDFSLRFRGHGASVVSRVDLTISAGETLCIVGESGCGKSVTSMAIMGLLPKGAAQIESGQMQFDGREYDLRREVLPTSARGRRMAMIFQEPMTSLNPAFRIGDQIAEAMLCHTDIPRSEATERAAQMLRRVGIPAPEARLREYPHQLSGGMRQRVMIAMALINNPALLIADEPTTALDVTIQAQILDLIRDLQNQSRMGTIMITHDLGVVAEIATTVAVMYGGQIVETGPVGQIFDDPQHPYTIGLMASMPALTGPRGQLATVPGTVPGIDAMPTGCRFRTRCPFAAEICARTPPMRDLGAGHGAACHFVPLDQCLAVSA
ncbi:ABC transporter ATP-binding protein [Sedimentitalea nanhaiensis]|uniref:Peptide/nickel transport system ATP-binding protein n=1 Tax=Sedimentitalea nanhaiensis TaxID=999627 RepID=A0A1I7BHA3_9RHOB|nr:ABC transporter ATP-binding protein [Sedimentitalea nanhaiensis]SFT86554.1 peptide/nickel transport system ATP-binding protein [Sedimentitalea nanhaiensis]